MPHWYENPDTLKSIRRSLNLTQTELAKKAGVKRQLIADIETGRRPLSEDVGRPIWRAVAELKRIQRGSGRIPLSDLMYPPLEMLQNPYATGVSAAVKTHERAKDKLIAAQSELIKRLDEIIEIHKAWGSERDAKITDLESRITELRDLLDLNTNEALLRNKIESREPVEKEE
jgi:transcriptional regulator with XRE-family HTH domain